ncbi:carboxylate--amine ligase [Cytobacillus dafuensis]|uniref:Carboxylate--amine ligase n=1 Tax=Cytobacillus dafuensis TaxID=1742359 RepID=A0A5B8YZH4_CYTDA|nr:carboxylate--amine ligase [Cytobacillus dafuensis]QED46080.1 carboxylate--amine ligase [Cytobacillus dafuensis]
MNNKAVILGCNYYIGLSAIRCLGVHGIHTVAVDYSSEHNYAADSKYCSERLSAPHYKNEKDDFVQFLIDYAKRQSVPPVLIPCHDSYVEVIDQHLEELKEYYLITQTEQGLWTNIMNKEILNEIAKEKGVLIPETVRVEEENFIEKIEENIKYPCIVKPTDSPAFVAIFRRKVFKVQNREELEAAIKKANDAGLEVIVQRIIPGFDDHMYTFDAYLNQESKVTHWVSCQKYRQFPINFGASVYTVQKYVPELYEIGAKFLEDIHYKGFAEIEFKKDAETGKFYLIEINARITTLNNMLNKVGVNFPYITYLELTKQEIGTKAIEHDTNIAFCYAYEDILAIKDYMKTGQLSIPQIIPTLFKKKTYAIWDWNDPKPAISFLKMMNSKMFSRLSKS